MSCSLIQLPCSQSSASSSLFITWDFFSLHCFQTQTIPQQHPITTSTSCSSIIMFWLWKRWYRRKAVEIYFQFMFVFIFFPAAIKNTVRGFPRPLMDLSMENFARALDLAFGRCLVPPFDPYANDINFLLASYVIPFVGLNGYVGAIPLLQNTTSKALVAGLLGIEAGQDAVIRTLLYERRTLAVDPYGVTVEEFSNRISMARNTLGNPCLIKDEGLVVPIEQGAEGRVTGTILAGNNDSLAYSRTPQEVLRILYVTGNESVPGGFFPNGASGRIATSYLCST